MQVYSAGLRVRDWKYKAALACHGQSVMRCLHYSWFLRRADLCESAYIKGMALISRPQTLRAVVMTAVCCFGFLLFFSTIIINIWFFFMQSLHVPLCNLMHAHTESRLFIFTCYKWDLFVTHRWLEKSLKTFFFFLPMWLFLLIYKLKVHIPPAELKHRTYTVY